MKTYKIFTHDRNGKEIIMTMQCFYTIDNFIAITKLSMTKTFYGKTQVCRIYKNGKQGKMHTVFG